MFSMSVDTANNIATFAVQIYALAAGLVGLLFWIFRLKTDVRMQGKQIEKLEAEVDRRTVMRDQRHDGLQTSVNQIQTKLGGIDAKLEILLQSQALSHRA